MQLLTYSVNGKLREDNLLFSLTRLKVGQGFKVFPLAGGSIHSTFLKCLPIFLSFSQQSLVSFESRNPCGQLSNVSVPIIVTRNAGILVLVPNMEVLLPNMDVVFVWYQRHSSVEQGSICAEIIKWRPYFGFLVGCWVSSVYWHFGWLLGSGVQKGIGIFWFWLVVGFKLASVVWLLGCSVKLWSGVEVGCYVGVRMLGFWLVVEFVMVILASVSWDFGWLLGYSAQILGFLFIVGLRRPSFACESWDMPHPME